MPPDEAQTPIEITDRRFYVGVHLALVDERLICVGVDLPAAMEAVATAERVPYINLTAASAALVESLGVEGSKALYLYTELKDNTHFSEYGADQIGRLVLSGQVQFG